MQFVFIISIVILSILSLKQPFANLKYQQELRKIYKTTSALNRCILSAKALALSTKINIAICPSLDSKTCSNTWLNSKYALIVDLTPKKIVQKFKLEPLNIKWCCFQNNNFINLNYDGRTHNNGHFIISSHIIPKLNNKIYINKASKTYIVKN